ncbi:MAG: hypothetical protein GY777_06130 [Candidatus Brocadiaceae bacterium]|nr:hypothetical protein [Candidatus Brocadiaceae bacterium]
MQNKFTTLIHSTLLIITIFSWTLLPVQPVNARKIVKDKISIQKNKVYLIEENDVLAISVFEEPGLSLSFKVAKNGTIAFPLIGETEVRGLTTYEIEQKLEKHLKDGEFLINPKVSIKLDILLMKQYDEKDVFIIGAVVKSGPISVMGKYISVLEAVVMAGGFTDVAAPDKTTVTRIEEGKNITINVYLDKIKKGEKSLDILLKTGDIINVPETYF